MQHRRVDTWWGEPLVIKRIKVFIGMIFQIANWFDRDKTNWATARLQTCLFQWMRKRNAISAAIYLIFIHQTSTKSGAAWRTIKLIVARGSTRRYRGKCVIEFGTTVSRCLQRTSETVYCQHHVTSSNFHKRPRLTHFGRRKINICVII